MTTERGRSFAESGPRGGSDLWDDDVGGSILTVEFFGEPPAPIDVGRAVATASTRTPSPLKTEDVGRALATASTYTPEVRPLIVAVGRALATVTAYAPATSKTEDVDSRALAVATGRTPSVDAVLGVARVTARAIRPLDVITNTERRGSAGWRSWRRA